MDKVTEIAKMIGHSILHPTLTHDDLRRGCQVEIQEYEDAGLQLRHPCLRKPENSSENN